MWWLGVIGLSLGLSAFGQAGEADGRHYTLLKPVAGELPVVEASAERVFTPAPAKQPGLLTLRANVREVQIFFSASDARNQFVSGLRPDDITILDDGIPATITGFQQERDLPIEVGLLMDLSRSLERQRRVERAAAAAFLQSLLSGPNDRAFVVGFSTKVRVLQTATGNHALLATSIEHSLDAVPPSGLTSLFDAVRISAQQGFPEHDGPQLHRRALIILSDGDDTDSVHSLSDAIAAAQSAGIAVYGIAIHNAGDGEGGIGALRQMAQTTGGRVFAVSKKTPATQAFASIENELRTQYGVTFRPSRTSLGFHTLQVIPTEDRKLSFRSRTGYEVR